MRVRVVDVEDDVEESVCAACGAPSMYEQCNDCIAEENGEAPSMTLDERRAKYQRKKRRTG